MAVRVKICGLTRAEHVRVAAKAGAAYIGFNHIERSPRFVSLDKTRVLAADVPTGVAKVMLVIEPDNALLDAIVAEAPIDMIQLHGKETSERVVEVRARTGLPVIKAVGVGEAEDVGALEVYSEVADQILVDAKPPKSGDLPGGNGVTFDWRLIANRRWSVPWMLAGGLTPDNVAEAIALTGAQQLDVASGVESAPGEKDPTLIERFMAATR
ncbi:MAG: phosphoribosylanthranilate isomerase [Pseudomonadota bacterium]